MGQTVQPHRRCNVRLSAKYEFGRLAHLCFARIDHKSGRFLAVLRSLSLDHATGRFVYIDIGKSAAQFESCWQRRIKIPLEDITWSLIDAVSGTPKGWLQATIPGTGKDGGPSCATVKLIDGW
jgi:hypothetical protein